MVFVVLFLGECQLLDPSLCATLRLLSLHQTTMLIVKLGLKILQALKMMKCVQNYLGEKNLYFLLESAGDFAPTLDCQLLSLVQLCLHVFHLAGQKYFGRRWSVYLAVEASPVLFSRLSIFLLSPELIRQTSSINH